MDRNFLTKLEINIKTRVQNSIEINILELFIRFGTNYLI